MNFKTKIVILISICFIAKMFGQSAWPSQSWSSVTNLTSVMSSSGVTDLSGLFWNSQRNRLYCVQGDGHLRVLQLNTTSNTFTQIANKTFNGGPEGITQVNLGTNDFYTIDENNYEIRKYTHSNSYSNLTLSKSWNLLLSPSPMIDTANTGPEGIAFIPDTSLAATGFVSQQTGLPYTSTKGFGGLFFIAHQDEGYIWVFDVNPNVSDDFLYIGKYKTNQQESCDLAFDASTNMLYILHNFSGNNTLEVTDLASTIVTASNRKLHTVNEYFIPNASGSNQNIEGFTLTSKCPLATVNAWLCRDVETSEASALQNDVLRLFSPFQSDGTCEPLSVNETVYTKKQFVISPNPCNDFIKITNENEMVNDFSIEVYNVLGQLLYKSKPTQNQSLLDTNQLDKGNYLIKIVYQDYIQNETIIKR